jgi:hypothetical protein
MQYRTKSKTIEAVRWTGKNFSEVEDFLTKHGDSTGWDYRSDVPGIVVQVGTHDVCAMAGDWLVSCRLGSFCVCGDGVFKQTYEPCEE